MIEDACRAATNKGLAKHTNMLYPEGQKRCPVMYSLNKCSSEVGNIHGHLFNVLCKSHESPPRGSMLC